MRYHYKSQLNARQRRHLRVRAKVSGTSQRPRLNVFRSSAHIYAQLIDDTRHMTLAAASSLEPSLGEQITRNRAADAEGAEGAASANDGAGTKTEKARAVGQLIGARAQELGITTVVFDRGGFKYHGRVKAVADGAREAGLAF